MRAVMLILLMLVQVTGPLVPAAVAAADAAAAEHCSGMHIALSAVSAAAAQPAEPAHSLCADECPACVSCGVAVTVQADVLPLLAAVVTDTALAAAVPSRAPVPLYRPPILT